MAQIWQVRCEHVPRAKYLIDSAQIKQVSPLAGVLLSGLECLMRDWLWPLVAGDGRGLGRAESACSGRFESLVWGAAGAWWGGVSLSFFLAFGVGFLEDVRPAPFLPDASEREVSPDCLGELVAAAGESAASEVVRRAPKFLPLRPCRGAGNPPDEVWPVCALVDMV